MHVKEIVIPERIESASPEQVLAWSLEAFQPRIRLCTSFAAEGVVLIDMLTKLTDRVRIFTLDTGRLMPETYAVIEAIRERYDLDIEVFFPRTEAVEAMTREEGVNLFYRSVEARKRCCAVRKVEPLARALAGLDAWIAGLRRDQAETRTEVRKVEIDEAHGGIVKMFEVEAPEHGEAQDSPAVAYVRPHDIEVERGRDGRPVIDVIVRHILTTGSRVRLDLERTDSGGLIEAEVSQERYRELKLAVGDQVYVRPRAVRVFVN